MATAGDLHVGGRVRDDRVRRTGGNAKCDLRFDCTVQAGPPRADAAVEAGTVISYSALCSSESGTSTVRVASSETVAA